MVQVWSVSQPEWHCKVDEGPVGLAFARWAPDGRHVLAAADFQLRITIWSLLDRSVCYIRFPKFAKEGLAFSPDGRSLLPLAAAGAHTLVPPASVCACRLDPQAHGAGGAARGGLGGVS